MSKPRHAVGNMSKPRRAVGKHQQAASRGRGEAWASQRGQAASHGCKAIDSFRPRRIRCNRMAATDRCGLGIGAAVAGPPCSGPMRVQTAVAVALGVTSAVAQ
ncbi:hypothetical protein LA76x_0775 [Lysobacter antibioticus]|uniref:Uncharacterized protein n=1 Tax=Lysobacter antibioticus TaxID=84531 RepID=A0A0S2F5W7_LYSAN|nr:hypothetical protein LA76x_0775 [Lysobacter antibioticus]